MPEGWRTRDGPFDLAPRVQWSGTWWPLSRVQRPADPATELLQSATVAVGGEWVQQLHAECARLYFAVQIHMNRCCDPYAARAPHTRFRMVVVKVRKLLMGTRGYPD